jgi:hypothetical protein
MKSIGFGTWLWQNQEAANPDMALLLPIAIQTGRLWPLSSTKRGDYEAVIQNVVKDEPARANALAALGRLWAAYLADPDQQELQVTGQSKKWPWVDRIVEFLVQHTLEAVVFLLVFILVILLWQIVTTDFLTKLATLEASRSLITFLFGVTTVCISLIVVLTALLGPDQKEERAVRFQQGKDILTVLIGVFGTIIGFYFGSTKQPSELNTTTVNAPGATVLTSTPKPGTVPTIPTPTSTPAATPGSTLTSTPAAALTSTPAATPAATLTSTPAATPAAALTSTPAATP